jgi:predicted nucleotidyltransferase
MLPIDNRQKILQVFFDDPLTGFQLREISRKVGIAPKSVRSYLVELEKAGLIMTRPHRIQGFPVYYANRDDDRFIFFKRLNTQRMIFETGLLGHLYDQCMPDVIILYGSASRGEDIKGSDIDIFMQCEEKDLQLSSFEQELGRKIHLFFQKDFMKLSEELKNNLINGDKLRGYLRFKWKKDSSG